ncbi:hypothetical protein N657DRAFT_641111 [Parathielavia appendiculata]|uniref:Zn(2)-C6 fungal-type domain-containing protein n=1 Tax=Parathielavia appendiculata TaxID=2587402 RepID=A0AAN6U797_9PEZI|nr:hypothetical protein N657DRAFT_641111 [Parathielavia appendiculata]
MQSQTEQQSTIRRRRRPALSCRECRRRKIKCDHNKPCAQCVRHNAQCFYKPFADKDPTRRRGLQSTGGSRVRDDGSPVGSRPTTVSAASPPPTVPIPLVTPEHTPDQIPILRDILQRIQKLETLSASGSGKGNHSSPKASPEAAQGEPAQRSLTPQPLAAAQGWQSVMNNKPRDWGRSRWVGGAPEFTAIITCYSEIMGRGTGDTSYHSPEAAVLVSQAGHLLRKSKIGAKSIKVDRPAPRLNSPGVVLTLPPRETADAKARLYFAAFESTHRILHVPTFWTEYQRCWDHPDSITADLRLKVLLVIGIGSSLYDHGDVTATHRNTESVQQWICAAQTWISGPVEKDRLDITGLQIHCLTMLARQLFAIGGDTVWVSMGSLVHGAMQIGLHRDPKHLPAMPVLQAELRRRLWATILELVVQSSLDAWMPLRISLDEFNTEHPSNINDDEIEESTTVLRSHPRDRFTSTSMQLAMLDSLSTRFRVVQLLNDLQSNRSYNQFLTLTSELTSALQAYTTLFTRTNSNESNGPTPFHRNLLDYLARRFIVPLHFPYSHQARTNPMFHYSVKVSLDAALALVSPGLDDGGMFARLMAISGGLFREGIRSATAAISLELLAHVETQRRDGSLQRTSQWRDFLKQVVRDLAALSEERIRKGETNVKSHMFLSMVLAHVEAIEEDKPVEVAVARAARDSLEMSERWLSSRMMEGLGFVGHEMRAGLGGSSSSGEGGIMDEIDGFGFEGFSGEEFAWETFFADGRFG